MCSRGLHEGFSFDVCPLVWLNRLRVTVGFLEEQAVTKTEV